MNKRVFREDYLILHSRKTRLKINNINIDDEDFNQVFREYLDYYIERFKRKFNTDIIIFGDMVCVENTEINQRRYKQLQKTAIDYEKAIVERMNKLTFY